jgi:cyanophycinase
MAGYILLAGGAEFGGRMAPADQRAIYLAGGSGAAVRIIPAAAAPDNDHIHAGNNGVRWFKSLGARDVSSLGLIDRESADQSEIAAALRAARVIYLLGGSPRHLHRSLAGSLSWEAVLEAHQGGAVVGGSSAGAMVLCAHFFDPRSGEMLEGLNLMPNSCLLPHFKDFGRRWVERLRALLPEAVLIGLEEGTAIINDGVEGKWTVYGGGKLTLLRPDGRRIFTPGESFNLDS